MKTDVVIDRAKVSKKEIRWPAMFQYTDGSIYLKIEEGRSNAMLIHNPREERMAIFEDFAPFIEDDEEYSLISEPITIKFTP